MIDLIKANIYKLTKTKYFYIAMVLSVLAGVGIIIAANILPIESSDGIKMAFDVHSVLSFAPGAAGLFIPFIAAATVGLFLEAEYTQGAIRNKIICGHSRANVYFSLFFTMIGATVIFFVLYEAAVFATAMIAYDLSDVMVKAVLSSLGTLLLLIVASSTALSFMIGGFIHGGKLIAILLGIQYAMEFFLVAYGVSDKFEVLDIISRLAPQGTMFALTYYTMPDRLWINCIFAVALFGIFTFIGYNGFKKGDIN